MDAPIKEAMHALFVGNREAILKQFERVEPSGVILWLLACAEEDTPKRLALLEQVAASGTEPYRQMASEVVAREKKYRDEIQKDSAWRAWLRQRLGR